MVSDGAGDVVRRVRPTASGCTASPGLALRVAAAPSPAPPRPTARCGARRLLGARGAGHRRRLRRSHGGAILHGQAARHGHPRRADRDALLAFQREVAAAAGGHRHRPRGASDRERLDLLRRAVRAAPAGRGPVRDPHHRLRGAPLRDRRVLLAGPHRARPRRIRRPRRSCSASRASWARSSGRLRRPRPPSARATRWRRAVGTCRPPWDIVEDDLAALEAELEAAVPWTEDGRFPFAAQM